MLSCGRLGFDSSAAVRGDAPHGDVAPPDAPPDVPPDTPASVAAIFEAESGTLTTPFEIATDSTVHDGAYLLDNDPQGLGGPGAATFAFSIPMTATYYIWGRTLAPDLSTDSFFLAIDGGAKLAYDTSACSHSTSWKWAVMFVPGSCPNTTGIQPFALTAGMHTLELSSREGLSAIDRILITSDPIFDAKD